MKSQLNRHAIMKNLALLLFMGMLSTTAYSLEENVATGKSRLQLMQEKKGAQQKAIEDVKKDAENEALKAAPGDLNGLVEGYYRPYIELAKSIGCPNLSKKNIGSNKKLQKDLDVAKKEIVFDKHQKMLGMYKAKSCSGILSYAHPVTLITLFKNIIVPMIRGEEDAIMSNRKMYLHDREKGTCEGMNAVEWYDNLYEAVESYKSGNPDASKMLWCGVEGGL